MHLEALAQGESGTGDAVDVAVVEPGEGGRELEGAQQVGAELPAVDAEDVGLGDVQEVAASVQVELLGLSGGDQGGGVLEQVGKADS
ncbi:hypothetical protein SVIO_000290 [Streptomyces violaceusniger]|uniref:Uncharacterized protein n=1 Tax=Streptomyces violaceusniger TaxID=68280 RepID=A0A4D4KR69_STRVO|nr:hypothetical protein SVIO_000290 [Streptomyces violaceusniger]